MEWFYSRKRTKSINFGQQSHLPRRRLIPHNRPTTMTHSTDVSSAKYLGILFLSTLLVSVSGFCPSTSLPDLTNRVASCMVVEQHAHCWGCSNCNRNSKRSNNVFYVTRSDDIDLPTVTTTTAATATRAPPRTGLAQQILDWALTSPVWKLVLVPQARANIVKTAEANQIPWTKTKAWIQNQMMLVHNDDHDVETDITEVPDYYKRAFHAYEMGNLSWEAAYEVEIASCAVGARNFPQYGSKGEDAFRGAFTSALLEAGAHIPVGSTDGDHGNQPIRIADFGCGTGMSTRRLAQNFPQADAIIGIDLSPFFIAVGKRLLELAPLSFHDGGPWVSTIQPDKRIEYIVGDVSASLTRVPQLQDESVDVVNVQFVLHELPPDVAQNVVDEACRVLTPKGQLWICEMDFESPAYAAQRSNPLLFSLIRSTEPYLDVYAESISSLFAYVQGKFERVKVVPATGRHFALVATNPVKGVVNAGRTMLGTMEDVRFDEDGNYRVEDTHLKVWESRQNDV